MIKSRSGLTPAFSNSQWKIGGVKNDAAMSYYWLQKRKKERNLYKKSKSAKQENNIAHIKNKREKPE
jgi:hypothetical protein